MWRKQQNKSHHFWSMFGHSKVVWKTANGIEFLCQCLNIPSLNSVLVTTLWSLVSLQPIQTSPSSFKQSCRARCVQQTLFKDPILNHPLSLSNRGLKIESMAIFRLRNISNHLIDTLHSHDLGKSMQKDGTSLTSFWPSIWIFAHRCQCADIIMLGANYPLICCFNVNAPLIKVGEYSEMVKLCLRLIRQFSP